MKKTISILALLASFILGSQQALACSVTPYNPLSDKNILAAELLNHLEVDVENVTGISTSEVDGGYIWTPMCPKGTYLNVSFDLTYVDVTDGSNCAIRANVSGRWEDDKEDEVEISLIAGGAYCTVVAE